MFVGRRFGSRLGLRTVSVFPARLEGPQLFSNSERRSSLLLLGRSGGSKYESSSSGFANSGRRSKDGSGMSDPDASRPLPGVNDRSPWGWLPGVCGCCCGGCGGCCGGGTCL